MLLYLHTKEPLHSADGDTPSAALWRSVVVPCYTTVIPVLNLTKSLPGLHLYQFSSSQFNYLTRNSLKREVILAHSLREQPRMLGAALSAGGREVRGI